MSLIVSPFVSPIVSPIVRPIVSPIVSPIVRPPPQQPPYHPQGGLIGSFCRPVLAHTVSYMVYVDLHRLYASSYLFFIGCLQALY